LNYPILEEIIIYTDGACIGNPGPGGYAAIVFAGKTKKEISGGFRLTTNNRMELMAAIVALGSLPEKSQVTLHSDSSYLVNGMMKGWAKNWRAKNWKKGKAENVDLWERLLELSERHQVQFKWVMGHASNPYNNRCDYLSVQAAKGKNLPLDEPYEKGETRRPTLTLFDM
jgi:ribonuclease HI